MNDRKQFEAWSMSEEGGAWKPMWFVNSEDGYAHEELRKMWHTWQAARATPAQPDSVLWAAAEKLASIWDGCEGEGIDDIGATIRHDFKMFAKELGAQQPSPSSVGDAIRAMELSAINVSEEHMADWTTREKVAFEYGARAMRSEAAALAEQVQWQQMPEGWILVPDGATKEWKAALVKSGYKASTIIDDVLAAAPSIAQDGQKSEADHE